MNGVMLFVPCFSLPPQPFPAVCMHCFHTALILELSGARHDICERARLGVSFRFVVALVGIRGSILI